MLALLIHPETDRSDLSYGLSALSDECFTTIETKAVWRSIQYLIGKSSPIDECSVNSVGFIGMPSVSTLCKWTDSLSSTVNARHHICQLLQLEGARRLHAELVRQTEIVGRSLGNADATRAAIQAIASIEVGGNTDLSSSSDDVSSAFEAWERRRQGESQHIKTHIESFDHNIPSTVMPGAVWVLGGRPGAGKTALANCIAINNARLGKSVFFASLELSVHQLVDRHLSIMAGVDNAVVRMPAVVKPSDEEIEKVRRGYDALSKIERLKSKRYGKARASDILADALIHKARHGLDLLIIDYLQLLDGEGRSQYERVTSISKDVLALSQDLDVPILALSQLRRAQPGQENTRPSMSDLRDSGQIEQDAHLITLLWDDEPGDTEINVYVAKNRDGKKDYCFSTTFTPHLYRFE